MGCCSSKNKVELPTKYKVRTSKQMRDIIQSKIKINHIFLNDTTYLCYDLKTLKKFLKSDDVDSIKYKSQTFDCDNHALVLAGREAEWFSQMKVGAGSSFGIIHGDIRTKVADDKPRPHAVNFFIDDLGELYLIEPQSDAISKPTKNSTFWFVLL